MKAAGYEKLGAAWAVLIIGEMDDPQYVVKVGADSKLTGFRTHNPRFVEPESISNLLEEINA
jgi:hypothetical protein